MKDTQEAVDAEDKAERYDRIVRAAERVRQDREDVARLKRELRQAQRRLVESGYELSAAMHPVTRARGKP